VPDDQPVAAGTAVDPVCGMRVAMVDASLHFDHGGRRWWFFDPNLRLPYTVAWTFGVQQALGVNLNDSAEAL
jgi:beta-xylosidase